MYQNHKFSDNFYYLNSINLNLLDFELKNTEKAINNIT